MTESKLSTMDRIANFFRGRRYPVGTRGATKPTNSPLDLASSAQAYAVIIDGVLEPRTVSLAPGWAAACALQYHGHVVQHYGPVDLHEDRPEMVRALKVVSPNDQVVEVEIIAGETVKLREKDDA